MHILNIAGYKFTPLQNTSSLREDFVAQCASLALKGTILLSHEGINISLAGVPDNIKAFQGILKQNTHFHDMSFHETYSDRQPFKRLKVNVKPEIISFRQPEANPLTGRAPSISPATFKQWLDDNQDITVLDTRNDFEVAVGTFKGAVNLHLADFSELPSAIETIDRVKPIVMFCTGGIRCEKAALYMLNHGFSQVYQLDGGILGYFNQVGGAHFDGHCFVFDERIAVDCQLAPQPGS